MATRSGSAALPALYIRPGIRAVIEPLISSVLEQPVERGGILEGVTLLDDDAFEAVSSLVSSLRSIRRAAPRRSQGRVVYDLGCVAGMLAVLHIALRLQERLPGTQDLLESMNRVKDQTERKAAKLRSAKARQGGTKRQEQRRETTKELERRVIGYAKAHRKHELKRDRKLSRWALARDLAAIKEGAPGFTGLSRRRIYKIIRGALTA